MDKAGIFWRSDADSDFDSFWNFNYGNLLHLETSVATSIAFYRIENVGNVIQTKHKIVLFIDNIYFE